MDSDNQPVRESEDNVGLNEITGDQSLQVNTMGSQGAGPGNMDPESEEQPGSEEKEGPAAIEEKPTPQVWYNV